MQPLKKNSYHHTKEPVSKDVTAKDTSTLKKFAKKLEGNSHFSGILSIQLGDQLIINHAYCPHASFTNDQVFNTFSIGKIFTAIAIMQLAEQKLINLDDHISKYLDNEELDLPLQAPYDASKPDHKNLRALQENAPKITIRQLLNHTSGLTRIANEKNEQFVAKRTLKSLHPYSNYGYQLLAEIIGKYTRSSQASLSNFHKGFQDHLQQDIFQRANMHVAPTNAHVPNNLSDLSKDAMIEEEPYPHGNGCWKMRSQDLLAFNKALQTNGLLIQEMNLLEMIENHLGFQVDRNEMGEITGYGHANGMPDSKAFLYTFLSKGHESITVVALSDNQSTTEIKTNLEAGLKKSGYWMPTS